MAKTSVGLLAGSIERLSAVSESSCSEIARKKFMRNFREMIIWNHGIDIAVKIYEITKKFPNEERYGLTSQLTRAAVSIPSNIAEGCSRKSEKDFARFLEHSLGSAYEVETDLVISERIGYLTKEIVADCLSSLQAEQRQVHSLINKLRF